MIHNGLGRNHSAIGQNLGLSLPNAVVVAPVGFPAPAAAIRAIEAADETLQLVKTTPPRWMVHQSSSRLKTATSNLLPQLLATRRALFTVAFHAAEPAIASVGERVIAIAPERIDAFSQLNDTAWQGNRRRIATRMVPDSDPRFAEALTPEQLTSFYGRVLKAKKSRGDFFKPDDFLSDGAKQGVAAIARAGFTLLPIADREIEGIDSFETDDRVNILIRGVVKSELTSRLAPKSGVAVSKVIASSVRIARGSIAGQSILEVPNERLTHLQAALARSMTDREEMKDRSHLVAVGIQRTQTQQETAAESEITDFDPLRNVKTTEMYIGGQRRVEVFAGGNE